MLEAAEAVFILRRVAPSVDGRLSFHVVRRNHEGQAREVLEGVSREPGGSDALASLPALLRMWAPLA
jgi:hypothetical protein